MDFKTEVPLAEQRIRAYVRETPLEYSLYLSELTGCNVFLKLENLQYTGSFKVRGAMNKLLSLTPDQLALGTVAASSGNHGIAVAFGLHKMHAQGIIFVPEDASSTKIQAIRRYGAEVRFYGEDCALTEEYARQYALQHNMSYISPYNDPYVVSGQGTIGVELMRQTDRIDVVFVALGGGGLISGIGGYLKSAIDTVTVVGCSPENSPVMLESVKANRIVTMESKPTLSDGTAGGIEQEAITFPLCLQLIDDYILVSEEEIRKALRLFMETHHQLIEGAAGVAIASLLQKKGQFQNQNVVLVMCGANISLETLKSIL